MTKFNGQRRRLNKALLTFIVLSASPLSFAGGLINRKNSQQYWPKNKIRAVQAKLNEEGFDPGPADGLMGPKTKAAIKAFQNSKGIPIDGKISDSLLKALGT